MELTEFLLARVAEDEAVAREVWEKVRDIGERRAERPGEYLREYYEDAEGSAPSAYFDQDYNQGGYTISAARVLAQCAAVRRIVALHAEMSHECPSGVDEWGTVIDVASPCATLRALATIWADHPDYDPAWEV